MSTSFDPWQFAGKKYYPVEAHQEGADGEIHSTGISHEDYRRCHQERGSRPSFAHKSIPPFARNPQQLQAVLVMRAKKYLLHRPEGSVVSDDWKVLNRLCTTRALQGYKIDPFAPAVQHEMLERHKEAISRAGGYLELHSAVAYRSWLLGQDSVQVAESLGIDPATVRQNLYRLKAVARELGFDAGPLEVRKGRKSFQRLNHCGAKPHHRSGTFSFCFQFSQ